MRRFSRGCECVSERNSGLIPAQRAAKRRRLWKKYFWRRVAILGLLAAMAITLVTIGVQLIIPDAPPAVVEPELPKLPEELEEPSVEVPYPTADEGTVVLGAEVDAAYAVLVDVTTGRIVAQKGADVRAYPASITKMMTLLVAVETAEDLDATYEMPFELLNDLYIQEASVAGFATGEKVTVTDMLYGCILPSGADATIGLANLLAGDEPSFAKLMNDRAKSLGLKDTHFTNTSGLHDREHYTTVTDMAVILMAAMQNPLCKEVLSTYHYTTAKTPQNPNGLELYSTLFSRMYGTEPEGATVIAGKTGYTTEAGHTMASYATGDDGHDYVFVTMGGTNRWKATYDCINVLTDFFGGETADSEPTGETDATDPTTEE